MPPKKEDKQEETQVQPVDLVANPDPDGSNYVYNDVDHETVVGYQEQVHKDEA